MDNIFSDLNNFLMDFDNLYGRITASMDEWKAKDDVMDIIKINLHEV